MNPWIPHLLRAGGGGGGPVLPPAGRTFLMSKSSLILDEGAGNQFCDAWTLTESHLELARLPTADDTLTLRCYLLPDDMVADADEPQIRPVYHVQMADWAISRCYLLPDSELFDEQAAQRYEARFVQSFGERPNALTHRNRRSKSAKCIVNNGYI